MTEQEFLDKMESEGPAYAFTDYGLKASHLDADVSEEFRNAAKVAEVKFAGANAAVERLYELANS